MLKNLRIHTAQFPGVEKRRPVNERNEVLSIRSVAADVNRRIRWTEISADSHLRLHRKKGLALRRTPVSANRQTSASARWRGRLRGTKVLPDFRHDAPGRGHIPRGFAPRMPVSASWLIKTADHRYRARGVQDVDHRLAVTRRNLHRRVGLARGRSTDEQRQFRPCRSISRATCAISSSDGVISPLRPMMSTFCSRAPAKFSRMAPSRQGQSPRSCCSRARRRQCSCQCHARRP